MPRRKGERLLINLINRGPAVSVLPPKRILIAELPPLEGVVPLESLGVCYGQASGLGGRCHHKQSFRGAGEPRPFGRHE